MQHRRPPPRACIQAAQSSFSGPAAVDAPAIWAPPVAPTAQACLLGLTQESHAGRPIPLANLPGPVVRARPQAANSDWQASWSGGLVLRNSSEPGLMLQWGGCLRVGGPGCWVMGRGCRGPGPRLASQLWPVRLMVVCATARGAQGLLRRRRGAGWCRGAARGRIRRPRMCTP